MRVRLQALTRPSALAYLRGAPPGAVVARFARAAAADVGGLHVAFLTDPEAAHPLALVVDGADLDGLDVGAVVRFADLDVDASLDDPPFPVAVDPAAVRRNVARLGRSIALHRRPSDLLDAIDAIDDGANVFAEPVRRLRDDLAAGAVDLGGYLGVFGGGAGLTPSWDDLATGLLLADRRAGADRARAGLAFLDALRDRTTAPAYWQVLLAAEGRSSLRLERLVDALLARDAGHAEIARVAGTGHASGLEILAGVRLRLAAGFDA